jgi:WD40 repeat protein
VTSPLNHNFYVTGGAVPGKASSYVRRRADRELLDWLRAGEYCYVLTSRQMGKSSLVVRTRERLRSEAAAVIVLSLTAIGTNLTVEQWYFSLLRGVGDQLDLRHSLDQFWDANTALGPLERWRRALSEVVLPHAAGQVVIFIDEIDIVRNLPFRTDEFFAAIRECYNVRPLDPALGQLAFCLLGVATPTDLISDPEMTPFNIGRRVELHDFTEEEATLLAQGLHQDPTVAQKLLRRVLHWTGGHPYLTQSLCRGVVELPGPPSERDVDAVCERLFFSDHSRHRDSNLQFVRDRLLKSRLDVAGLLELYGRAWQGRPRQPVPDDETNPLVSELRLAGIVRGDTGRLRVRNRIYERVFDRRWAREHMPDVEVRRQRAAFRKGLLRASGIAALVLLGFGALTGFALYKSGKANEAVREAQAARQEAERTAYLNGVQGAMRQLSDSNIILTEEILDHCPEPHHWEWHLLKQQCDTSERTLRGHEGAVRGVAYHPSGKWLASCGEDGTVRVWDAGKGAEYRVLRGHQGVVYGLAFDRSGNYLASAGADGSVRVWGWDRGVCVRTFDRHRKPVRCVAFGSVGGKGTIASGDNDGALYVWDASSGTVLWHNDEVHRRRFLLAEQDVVVAGGLPFALWGERQPIRAVSFSGNGELLASASGPDVLPFRDDVGEGSICIWDMRTRRPLGRPFGNKHSAVHGLAFRGDGKQLASAHYDSVIQVWKPNGELVSSYSHGTSSRGVAYSPDGKHLASVGQDMTVQVSDAEQGDQASSMGREDLPLLRGHRNSVLAVSYRPDGLRVASASRDGTVKIWDVTRDPEAVAFLGHSAFAFAVAFRPPDGRQVASAGLNREIRLWDPRDPSDKRLVRAFPRVAGIVRGLAFSPDGRRLASAEEGGTVHIWDPDRRTVLRSLTPHSATACCVAFRPATDGRQLASGGNDGVKLWDANTPEHFRTLPDWKGKVPALAFDASGRRLAAACGDGVVRVWDLERGGSPAALRGHAGGAYAVAFHPDGRQLASAGEDRIILVWDAETGERRREIKGHLRGVFSLAFSPDGHRLASGSADQLVRLWDLRSGQEVYSSMGNNTVHALSFSPDGHRLAAASAYPVLTDDGLKAWGKVRVWDATPQP